MSDEIDAFKIAAPDADLEDLKHRLRATRWPERECVDDWSQGTACGREGDLNPRAPSAFGLLKTPRVRPIILRSFSETSHREFIRHQFDTFQTYPLAVPLPATCV